MENPEAYWSFLYKSKICCMFKVFMIIEKLEKEGFDDAKSNGPVTLCSWALDLCTSVTVQAKDPI